ncbi:MAG: glutamine-hydrolyzing carbamoyl-phosphate synthase small subunit [Bacteroidales bacterium]|nr:glutamine-hydrolyzing carbamoyl-phosphate synthase small subunit [Bacteroidales bacterium]
MNNLKKAELLLEDGTRYEGFSFGAEKSMAGEVVFNTAMTGYTESLTDPSYKGQILVATYPMSGNYGIPGNQQTDGILDFFESDRIHVQGLVVDDYSFEYSHWNAAKSLADYLKENDVPGIYGIDTRALTKRLREKGSMLGKIIIDGNIPADYDPNKDNLVAQVSCKDVTTYGDGSKTVVLVDCGVKNNIVRCFTRRGAKVIRVPWDYDFTTLDYDGLFISNGPGDPKMCTATIDNLRKALQQDKPIYGICLGNQLLALAAGFDTYKLKYGHRSHNQPVLREGTDRCYITSQNHGYAIDMKTISSDWSAWFVNVNDGTCEGIRHKTRPIFSTQFHPEACGGPVDTEFLFDEFVKLI